MPNDRSTGSRGSVSICSGGGVAVDIDARCPSVVGERPSPAVSGTSSVCC